MNTAQMRARAEAIFQAGVKAADPFAAVTEALSEAPVAAPGAGGRTLVVAVGKAAMRMAEAAMAHVPAPREVLVVTNYENAGVLEGAQVFAAGHPVPDEGGAKASAAVLAALEALGPQDRVLALISGGGSALLPAPVAGVSLADKAEVNRLLLASGADIGEMNLVRQQLSRLKGGGLSGAAAPAPVRALILSDVVGDDLRVIASGPTVAPIGTRAQAMAILKARGVWAKLPEAVREHLETLDAANAPPRADNTLVGSNAISLAAMTAAAGAEAIQHEPALVGDVAKAAARVMAEADRPGIHLFGGETTVVLKGKGLGGRNQELALRVALLAEQAGWPEGSWVFLSGGTDGRDGPCDAAGAVVDGGTLARMRAAGVEPQARLDDNDSYHALQASGDLLMTGATGTNVADLQVLIRV
ncbi:Putative hydroxypyruvate reductase [Pseudoruegeria aquimaris]|uniref:Putative hydroxypyruvate reductase n=1 Tax=Pseudoruegeria aquimaris TaxID=393663 RepID=A0A1Y5S813_9RHOB|nr:DUF4147 domain-containing protein [Pseudoruegeria aquimaris]SLN33597.1 Putative hydroxypyruvate reductase [Pseudoruegeria aquimaris]